MNVSDPYDQGVVIDARPSSVLSCRSMPQGRWWSLSESWTLTAPDLEAVLATQSGLVVVDLRELSFIDLTGLRLLLDADARSRQRHEPPLHPGPDGAAPVRGCGTAGPAGVRGTSADVVRLGNLRQYVPVGQ